MKSVEPKLPGGFRDYLPEQMISRQRILETVKRVYEKFGFVPLETPGVEFESTLTGNNPEFDMRIFQTSVGIGGKSNPTPVRYSPENSMALRFDLTVPLARVFAANPELKRPFKRYQIGQVWRGEKPQAGRFREFIQFDADIVGSSSMLADAEIVNLIYEVLSTLEVGGFMIKINNRKLLNGLPALANFPQESIQGVLRTLDKMDKIGFSEVKKELMESSSLTEESIESIKRFQDIQGSAASMLQAAAQLFKDVAIAESGISELQEIASALKSLGVPEKNWCFDFSVARGLDYYTGPVFEAKLTELPNFGSVFGGGRYDGLISRFDKNAKVPATGASVGVDRLFAALEKLGKIIPTKTLTKVMVMILDPSLKDKYLQIATSLRRNGVNTELYLGEEMSFKAQFAYAVSSEIPLLVILGRKEVASGGIKLRNLSTRSERMVTFESLVEEVQKELNIK